MDEAVKFYAANGLLPSFAEYKRNARSEVDAAREWSVLASRLLAINLGKRWRSLTSPMGDRERNIDAGAEVHFRALLASYT